MFMRDACIGKIFVDIDRAICISAIWDNMSKEQLIELLNTPEMSTQDDEHSLRVICAWIDGGLPNNQLHKRLHQFRQLLEFVDLASITEGSLIDIISSNYSATESRPHR